MPCFLGQISHVYGQDHGQVEFCELGHEEQIATQIGRIGYGQNRLRSLHGIDVAEQHVHRNHLVW